MYVINSKANASYMYVINSKANASYMYMYIYVAY